ncbi:bifunctional 3,4-dihydroxy-2-butanone-4-phosphate synthase/GTP cyclohydrolase II [Agitococcus lubricus]
MDDEDRENEGDIVMAATHVRPEDINFMAKHARGLICLTLTRQRCQQLDLPLMVTRNGASHGTNFTLSIEAASGVTTGISAHDRAHTVQVAVARDAKPADIVQPGHIFPLMAQAGGVLHRAGHTEAGCDLARLAGLEPAAVIVEIMNEDGTMARRPDLEKFAEQHNLKMGTIADLIHYRMVHEQTVKRTTENILPTEYGDFRLISYQEHAGSDVHIALIKGELTKNVPVVRVHAVNPLRDLLHAKYQGRTGWNLQKSLAEIAKHEAGVLVLLGQNYASADLIDHIQGFFGQRARANDGAGMYRTIGIGSQILRDLGVSKMRLLSSPMRFNALSGFGLEIVEYLGTD